MKLESSTSDDDETKADIFHILSKLAKDFDIPNNVKVIDWMSENVFKKSKDAKKVRHLSEKMKEVQTKDQFRHRLESLASETLQNASKFSTDWTPGKLEVFSLSANLIIKIICIFIFFKWH
jgi:hypothetical protein